MIKMIKMRKMGMRMRIVMRSRVMKWIINRMNMSIRKEERMGIRMIRMINKYDK